MVPKSGYVLSPILNLLRNPMLEALADSIQLFNLGIKKDIPGYGVWMMMVIPKADALENLLAAESNELTLLNCAVIDIEDKKSFVWKTGGYKTLDEVNTQYH